jgi:hypothetical protein
VASFLTTTILELWSRSRKKMSWDEQARELFDILRKADPEVAVQLLAHTLNLVEQTGICLGLDQGRKTLDESFNLASLLH